MAGHRAREDDAEDTAAPPPNEHTRLLPNRLDSELPTATAGYLSPDDPAVTPYNLFTVRVVRAFTVLLVCATFIWWTLLLVATFVTPPGFHTRGSGWFGLAYATVSLATLVITLLFFAVPSRAARVVAIAAAVLLLVDTILIAAVTRVRHEEAWTGLAAAAWATAVALWALAADRIVAWGKQEEETRLTGRPETRRSLGEWFAVGAEALALGVAAVAILLMTLTLVLRSLDARLEAPGEMYWVDGGRYQVHLYCRGNGTRGSPTVLLEGGEEPVETGLWQMAENAVVNGSIARYCFMDRPGIGWSDTAPSPFAASMASDALSEALARANEKGPFVLAAAGKGAIYGRVFASRHGREVRGLLLIDPLHEELLDRVGNAGRGFGLWLRGVISPLGLARVPGALFRGRSAWDRTLGSGGGKALFAKLQEALVANSLTRRDAISSRAIQDKNVPLVVVTSGEMLRRDPDWEDRQRDLTTVTDRLEAWDVVKDAPHRVWDCFEGRKVIERRLKELAKLVK